MFRDNKFIKRYQNDINLLGYNNKEMIKINNRHHNLTIYFPKELF